MKNIRLELVEAALTDIKNLVKSNPNDMDLGKKVRSYFLNLPDVIDDFKKEINTYDEGLN
jgi:hypothetical protein